MMNNFYVIFQSGSCFKRIFTGWYLTLMSFSIFMNIPNMFFENIFGGVTISTNVAIIRALFCLIHSGPENLKKSRQKKLVKSNISIFFVKLPFLAVLNFSPVQKNDFWPFLKCKKMEFGQKIFFVKLIFCEIFSIRL